MALPALFLPSSLEADGLDTEVAERVHASWNEWWTPFREDLRQAPPSEASSEERKAIATFAEHVFLMMKEVGPNMTAALQRGVQRSIEHILLRASQEIDAERRLGFHWLRQALESLGRVVDRFVYQMSPEVVTEVYARGPRTAAELEPQLDRASVLLLRLELSAIVAFDLISTGTSAEFCSWARRAATASRELDASFPFLFWSYDAATEIDLTPEVGLDKEGVSTVLRLLNEAPGPNQAMLGLFRGDDP